MSEKTVSLLIHGETLVLHPERALIWPRRRTVIVADTHFGKSSHFGRHGIPVPAGTDEADRHRLTRLVTAFDARRLIILGDFLHAPITAGTSDADDLQHWAERLAMSLEIHVVAGNHDLHASRLPPLHWWESHWIDPPFCFVHDANRRRLIGADSLFTVSGHVHPVIRLRSLGKSMLRVPIFWQKSAGLILPSFGQFTGGFAITPDEDDRIFGVGPTAIVPF
ncbi:MAG: ligase-associated DNA damage response endonuclease PdeM [Steroidobacteraceae bacterium]